MKRILSILIALLLCGTVMINANAQSQKIDPALQKILSSVDADEDLDLSIWLNVGQRPEPDFTSEDFETEEEYLNAYREYNIKFYTEKNSEILELIAQTVSLRVIYVSSFTPSVYVTAAAGDVEKIAAFDAVRSVSLKGASDDVPEDEPTYSPTEPTDPDFEKLYEKKYREWAGLRIGEYVYLELYHHFDSDGRADWALVKAQHGVPTDMTAYMMIGSRILQYYYGAEEFMFGYGIYDVKEEKFVDLYEIRNTPERYEGLTDALKEYKVGRPVGDVDDDNAVTIVDATLIQRELASIATCEKDYTIDSGSYDDDPLPKRYSDFDLDGETTIIDATKIQRTLASLE